jgi:potassium channel subfamily K
VQEVERECKTKDKSVLESRRHYHCVLITEIQKVIRHLNSSPPRKYTFDEWAWYLKLIGEDESTSATHRKVPLKPEVDGEGLGSATTNVNKDDENFNWSWVANRSPLIGDQEEAQWVLGKLTKVLDCELYAIRAEELQAERDGMESGEIKIVRQSRG